DAGGVLSYGLRRRVASIGQRRALAARDRGCSFPTCDRPPDWCESHHVTPWVDGGPTDLDNLTLFVRFSPPGTPETWLGGTYARWAASVGTTPLDRPNSNSSPEHHPSRGHRLPATRLARTEPHPDRRPLSRPDARLRLTPQVSRQSEAGPSVMALPVGSGPGPGWQFLLAEA